MGRTKERPTALSDLVYRARAEKDAMLIPVRNTFIEFQDPVSAKTNSQGLIGIESAPAWVGPSMQSLLKSMLTLAPSQAHAIEASKLMAPVVRTIFPPTPTDSPVHHRPQYGGHSELSSSLNSNSPSSPVPSVPAPPPEAITTTTVMSYPAHRLPSVKYTMSHASARAEGLSTSQQGVAAVRQPREESEEFAQTPPTTKWRSWADATSDSEEGKEGKERTKKEKKGKKEKKERKEKKELTESEKEQEADLEDEEDEEDDDEEDEDDDSSFVMPDTLPSIGSADHGEWTCKRCCFFPKGRCETGYDCNFCHFDHEKRKRKNKKKSKKNRNGGFGSSAPLGQESVPGDLGPGTAACPPQPPTPHAVVAHLFVQQQPAAPYQQFPPAMVVVDAQPPLGPYPYQHQQPQPQQPQPQPQQQQQHTPAAPGIIMHPPADAAQGSPAPAPAPAPEPALMPNSAPQQPAMMPLMPAPAPPGSCGIPNCCCGHYAPGYGPQPPPPPGPMIPGHPYYGGYAGGSAPPSAPAPPMMQHSTASHQQYIMPQQPPPPPPPPAYYTSYPAAAAQGYPYSVAPPPYPTGAQPPPPPPPPPPPMGPQPPPPGAGSPPPPPGPQHQLPPPPGYYNYPSYPTVVAGTEPAPSQQALGPEYGTQLPPM